MDDESDFCAVVVIYMLLASEVTPGKDMHGWEDEWWGEGLGKSFAVNAWGVFDPELNWACH